MDFGKTSLWLFIASIILFIIGYFFTSINLNAISIIFFIKSISAIVATIALSITSLVKYKTDNTQSRKTAIIILVLTSLIILFFIYVTYISSTSFYSGYVDNLPRPSDVSLSIINNASQNVSEPYMEWVSFNKKYNSINKNLIISETNIGENIIFKNCIKNDNAIIVDNTTIKYTGTTEKKYLLIAICGYDNLNLSKYNISDCDEIININKQLMCGLFIKKFVN